MSRYLRPLVVLALLASACGQTALPTVGAAHPTQAPPSQRPTPSAIDATKLPRVPPREPKVRATPPSSPRSPATADISAYGGLATWIDVYSENDVFGPQAFGDAATTAREMAARGVRTLFLEAGSYRHPAVAFPAATAALIRAAHAAGIKVIGWYLPMFRSVRHDLREVMRTIRFRTRDGQGFDGFALDIEADLVPPERRIANVLQLSKEIRSAVGPRYALGAIIPSPRGLIRVPSYWPGFPYQQLPRYYDVVLPMSYFTFHYHGAEATGRYIRDNVEIIRQQTGRPRIPIHVIGGIAGDMSPAETRAFVLAARSEHVFGASLYEFPGTSSAEWRILRPLPPP
jgi:hypothetical protein